MKPKLVHSVEDSTELDTNSSCIELPTLMYWVIVVLSRLTNPSDRKTDCAISKTAHLVPIIKFHLSEQNSCFYLLFSWIRSQTEGQSCLVFRQECLYSTESNSLPVNSNKRLNDWWWREDCRSQCLLLVECTQNTLMRSCARQTDGSHLSFLVSLIHLFSHSDEFWIMMVGPNGVWTQSVPGLFWLLGPSH